MDHPKSSGDREFHPVTPEEQEQLLREKILAEQESRWQTRGNAAPLIPDEPVRLRETDGHVHPPKIELRPDPAALGLTDEEAKHLVDGGKNNPHVRFTDELKSRFVELLASYGVKHKCAKAVGVCAYTVTLHEKKDQEFAEAVELAMEVFRDSIEETIIDRAIHGWREPMVSAGHIVGYVTKFDNRLLELLAKRHIHAYRDKQQLDVNVSGGVLVAPAPAQSVEEWRAQNTRPALGDESDSPSIELGKKVVENVAAKQPMDDD
jgi:predicted HTH domain antitoxin